MAIMKIIKIKLTTKCEQITLRKYLLGRRFYSYERYCYIKFNLYNEI